MRKEIAEKWVAKLRNPETMQAHDTLGNDEGGRCCLGVLADLYAEEHEGSLWGVFATCQGRACASTSRYSFKDAEGNTTNEFPTKAVCDWAGMSTHNGELSLSPEEWDALTGEEREKLEEEYYKSRTSLATMNDSLLWPFSKIADVIDKHWEKL